MVNRSNGDMRVHHIAGADGGHEFQRLAQIDRAMAGKLFADHRRDQAGGQHTMRDAAAMLGHWHRIEGEVIHGEKRGRELGYPTANMSIAGLHLPKFGVYAVKVDVLTGPQTGSYLGAASLGVRPMFGVNTPNLETFLLDFTGDLYGQQLSVALIDHLRPEMKFDGLPALMDQMFADVLRCREILAAL